MRKKMMYPFVILELLLFFMAMLTNITDIGIKSYIFTISALGLCFVYAFIYEVNEIFDRILAIISSLFIVSGEVCSNFLNIDYIGEGLYMLGFLILLSKVLMKYLENKKLLIISISSLVVLSIGFTFIFKLFTEMPLNVVLAIEASILLVGIVLGVYTYKHIQNNMKPNLYFFSAGLVFFLIYKSALVMLPYMNNTSALYGIISIAKFTFLIPAAIMAVISFKIFEPHAS